MTLTEGTNEDGALDADGAIIINRSGTLGADGGEPGSEATNQGGARSGKSWAWRT